MLTKPRPTPAHPTKHSRYPLAFEFHILPSLVGQRTATASPVRSRATTPVAPQPTTETRRCRHGKAGRQVRLRERPRGPHLREQGTRKHRSISQILKISSQVMVLTAADDSWKPGDSCRPGWRCSACFAAPGSSAPSRPPRPAAPEASPRGRAPSRRWSSPRSAVPAA